MSIGRPTCVPGPYGEWADDGKTIRLNAEGTARVAEGLEKHPKPIRLVQAKFPRQTRWLRQLGYNDDDLTALALYAHVIAMGRYDPTNGTPFESYLCWWLGSVLVGGLRKVEHHRTVLDLDRRICGKSGGMTFGDLLGMRDPGPGQFDAEHDAPMILAGIADEHTRDIVSDYYGFHGEPVLMRELAERHGVTRRQIGYVLSETLDTLRAVHCAELTHEVA